MQVVEFRAREGARAPLLARLELVQIRAAVVDRAPRARHVAEHVDVLAEALQTNSTLEYLHLEHPGRGNETSVAILPVQELNGNKMKADINLWECGWVTVEPSRTAAPLQAVRTRLASVLHQLRAPAAQVATSFEACDDPELHPEERFGRATAELQAQERALALARNFLDSHMASDVAFRLKEQEKRVEAAARESAATKADAEARARSDAGTRHMSRGRKCLRARTVRPGARDRVYTRAMGHVGDDCCEGAVALNHRVRRAHARARIRMWCVGSWMAREGAVRWRRMRRRRRRVMHTQTRGRCAAARAARAASGAWCARCCGAARALRTCNCRLRGRPVACAACVGRAPASSRSVARARALGAALFDVGTHTCGARAGLRQAHFD